MGSGAPKRSIEKVFAMSTLFVVGSIVIVLCGALISDFLIRKGRAAVTKFAGSILLLVMVFTHIAERFHLLMVMVMGWGRPDSAAHYLDLISAIGGIVLLCAGYAIRLME